MAPAVMEVTNDESQKTMEWPLEFAAPGSTSPPALDEEYVNKWNNRCTFETIPGGVVAVGSFSDASVGPIVGTPEKISEVIHTVLQASTFFSKISFPLLIFSVFLL